MVMIDKARKIIDAGRTLSTTMEARGKLESIIFCESYVEPGHDDPPSGLIAIGDLSPVTVSPISAVSDLIERHFAGRTLARSDCAAAMAIRGK